MQKIMLNLDAWKLADSFYWWRLLIEFLGGLGERGLAEFRQNSRLDFNCDLTRPAPQAGCGGCFLIQKRALDAKGSIEGTIFLDFS